MNESTVTTLFRSLNSLGLLAVSSILIFAIYQQFALNKAPCPLCLLQRVGLVAVMCGMLLNVMKGPAPRYYSVMIIGCMFGGSVSLRQISLHIIPGAEQFGPPFLGLHFYTWAFLCYGVILLGTAILASFSRQYQPQKFIGFKSQIPMAKLAIAVTLLVVAGNVLLTFAECGPGRCPADLSTYWLFK
jgi:disulfide bond formation protein DsbB